MRHKRKQSKDHQPRMPKWNRVFKLLRECHLHVKGGNEELAKSSAADARSAAMSYIRSARSETSMAVAVRNIIDAQILAKIKVGSDQATHYVEGAMACIKRLVAREAAQRAVARYQARLRKRKPHTRTWSEVDSVANQAIRDVRRELGDEAFEG